MLLCAAARRKILAWVLDPSTSHLNVRVAMFWLLRLVGSVPFNVPVGTSSGTAPICASLYDSAKRRITSPDLRAVSTT